MFYICQREWKYLPSSHHSFQKINIFMTFKKDREQTFNTSQTFKFSYLQMTTSKRCNKTTFLIWSLLHLINPEIFFPPDFSRAQLWLTRGDVSVCHPAVGVCGGRGARKEAGARRGWGRQAQFCHSSRYFGEQHFCT